MQTVSISWQHTFEISAVLTASGGLMSLSKDNRVRTIGAFFREVAVIGVLYGLWHFAGMLSQHGLSHAYRRAQWIRDAERWLPLPSEHDVQQLILGHSWVVQGVNLYYATMHFTMMIVFLIWLFFRHRDRYRPVRQVMAWTTLGCLLIQLIPVAPPRMLPGIVDTGKLYNQSVYSHGLAIDQLSAMPSVHVAWASFIGYYAWRVSPSRWRYLGFAHTAITVFVVVSSGNHWWADGIVAVLVLTTCAWAVYGVRTAWRSVLSRIRSAAPDLDDVPAPAAAGGR